MTFKDFWKPKPHWLKGGILGILVMIAIFIFEYILIIVGISVFSVANFNALILKPIENSININLTIKDMWFGPRPTSVGYFVYVILSFLLGALMGLLIEKIKSKKQ